MPISGMTSDELRTVLRRLHDAGASRVPADEIGWTPDLVPAMNQALTMSYMIYRDTKIGRLYSLTDAGYQAIGERGRRLSFLDMIALAFGRG